ncbi:hypothetical protein ACTFIU_009378 [Dictyostelium citrinum]
MNPQFNELVKKYCSVAKTTARPSSNLSIGSSKAKNDLTTTTSISDPTPKTTTTTTTITTTISTDQGTFSKKEESDSFAQSIYEKLLKNSFKNKSNETVFVLYTSKHMDIDEITHHLGGKNQRGNVVEIYPHIYRVCSGKTVRIQSKKKDADKLFLSVVGENSKRILLLNFEKKSNSGLFKFNEKKLGTENHQKIEFDPKIVKRLIIYGKETKMEYKERRYLQLQYNESDSYLNTLKQKKNKRRENKEKFIGFLGDAAMKAIPTVSVSLGANFGKGGGDSSKDKKDKDGKSEKNEKSEKSEKSEKKQGKVIKINKNFNSNKGSKSEKTDKSGKCEKSNKRSTSDQSSESWESEESSDYSDDSDSEESYD